MVWLRLPCSPIFENNAGAVLDPDGLPPVLAGRPQTKPLDGVGANRQSIHAHGEDAALVRADNAVALQGHVAVDAGLRGVGEALEIGERAQGGFRGGRARLQFSKRLLRTITSRVPMLS